MKKTTILAYLNLQAQTEKNIKAKREEIYNLQQEMLKEDNDQEFMQLEFLENLCIGEREDYQIMLNNISRKLKEARKSSPATYKAAVAEYQAKAPAAQPIIMVQATNGNDDTVIGRRINELYN